MGQAASPLLTDLYQLNMIQAYLDHGETEDGGLRVLRAQAAGAARLPDRGRARAGARLSRDLRFSPEDIDWLAATGRFRQRLARLSRRLPLHRRRPRHAGGHGVLRRRADPARHRAAAAGAARRDAADQHPAFPDADRLQGGAHGAGRARQAAGRFRPAPRAWRRGRAAGGARELHRRLRRHRDGAGRAALRHPDLRHHGAFLRPGARRREPRPSSVSRARARRT